MRAITLQDGDLSFDRGYPEPSTADGESRIRVIQAGICETDLQLAQGYMDFSGVLGHEFVGVAETGPLAGQRVVGEINCNCQQCQRCKTGLGNHCADRTVLGIDQHDGAFADFVSLPNHNLHVLPDTVSNDQAVFVEPLAAAFQILEQVSVAAGDEVLVCGDGRLSLMCVSVLQETNAKITVVGKHMQKLERFNSLVAHTELLRDHENASALYDVAVDCTGSPTGLSHALQHVRPRGTLVMKTTVAAEHQLSLAKIVIDEITVVGSRCGPFGKAISALAEDRVSVEQWITSRYPIESGLIAFEKATASDSLKVILEINKG